MKRLLIISILALPVCSSYAQTNMTKIAKYEGLEIYKDFSSFKLENTQTVPLFVRYSVTITNSNGDLIELREEELITPNNAISHIIPLFGTTKLNFTSITISKHGI